MDKPTSKEPGNEPVECFAGFLKVQGVRLEIDFEVPVGASDTVKDAAFLAALAQQVDLDYLSFGERRPDSAALPA